MGTKEPPTTQDDKKCKRYDDAQAAGAAALALLQTWGTTTADIQAPWRQTGGGGGSEFGKPKWIAALKGGFKTASEPPRFMLWQLALADHVVRHSPPGARCERACLTCEPPYTSSGR